MRILGYIVFVAVHYCTELVYSSSSSSSEASAASLGHGKLLSLMTWLKSGGTFDYAGIRGKMRADLPELGESDSSLDSFIRGWRTLLHSMSVVPAWFHFVHLRSFPERPTVDLILSAAPADYSIRDPYLLMIISSAWSRFCISAISNVPSPCTYKESVLAHGKLQSGFFLKTETIARMISAFFEDALKKAGQPEEPLSVFSENSERNMMKEYFEIPPTQTLVLSTSEANEKDLIAEFVSTEPSPERRAPMTAGSSLTANVVSSGAVQEGQGHRIRKRKLFSDYYV